MEKIVFRSGIGTEGERQFTLGAGEAHGALDHAMPHVRFISTRLPRKTPRERIN